MNPVIPVENLNELKYFVVFFQIRSFGFYTVSRKSPTKVKIQYSTESFVIYFTGAI